MDKGKVFSDNSNLTNLVDVKRLYKNSKWIMCFWRGLCFALKDFLLVPHCFVSLAVELRYLRLSMIQQFLSRLPKIGSRWFLFIWSGKSSLIFKLFTTYPQEKSNHKKNHAYLDDLQYSTCFLKKQSHSYSICHRVDIHRLAKRLISSFC